MVGAGRSEAQLAIYHLSAKVLQRSHGRSAVAAAAYRAAAALHDEAVGRTFNYLAKPGVIHSQILLPEGAPARWLDRAVLWNEVERVERRRDAVLAREIELALPRELSQAEAIRLAVDFAQAQFVARGMVADLNVHWGRSADGEAQPHAHIMLSMRRVVPGPEGQPEKGTFGLKERGWNDKAVLRTWRTAWAELINARLAEAGIDRRVDHRSNAERGIDLEPQNKIGPAGTRRAVRGEDAERAEEHRAIARRNGERLLAEPGLALAALTQQQSTFVRQDLARLVHRHSDGAAQFTAIMARVEASPELVRVGEDGYGRPRFSTREMIELERQMEAAALDLSRRTTHPVAENRRRALLAGTDLGAEQRLAFGHVTRARDLTVVTGYAGTGKSTMLDVARRAWEAQGYAVRGAALSGIAAEGLEGGSGIASRTIASWEYAWTQGKEPLGPGDVLVVDEAGMVGSRQMGSLLTAVHRAGAKVVLVGDAEQLQAIEAGAAFRAIVERVGAVAITEVRRQQTGWQQEATRELATGRTGAALDRYDRAGMVHGHATDAAAEAVLIAGWQATRQRAPGASQIILAHARDDVRRLNEAARALRRAAGELGADRLLPTELGARAFAVGDRLYFLRNDRQLGVRNGSLGTVTGIAGEGAAAALTVRLDRPDRGGRDDQAAGTAGATASVSFALADYAHLDHGYAATIHKAQSVTVDHAHVLATPGMDRHLAYVALSRHRHAAALHWSKESFASRERLVGRLSRERAKDTSLDYQSEAELCAAYAERRGLQPLASGAERGPAQAGAPEAALSIEELRARSVQSPGLGWRNLQRVQLEQALRPVFEALQRAVEQQAATGAALAAALPRLARSIASRVQPVAAEPRPPQAGAPEHTVYIEEVRARSEQFPGLGWRNLQRVQLEQALRPVFEALQRAVEQQAATGAALAAALPRLARSMASRVQPVVPADPGPTAPQTTVVTATRRQPRDRVVTDETHRPEWLPPASRPPDSSRPSQARVWTLLTPMLEAAAAASEAAQSPAARPPVGRPEPGPPRRAGGKALPVPARPVSRPEQWPWTGLDPTPPASPLLPAQRYEPVTTLNVYAGSFEAVASARRSLQERYAEAYENPRLAEVRFSALVAKVGAEAAGTRVAQHPDLLGSLRGGWFTAKDRKERKWALSAARGIGVEEQRTDRAEEQVRNHYAIAEEQRRRREAIEVPDLSAKAQAAVDALADAGAKPGWAPHDLSRRGVVAETVLATARTARVYDAIRADAPLLAELERLEAAVGGRLAFGEDIMSKPRHIAEPEIHAAWYHGVLVAARARHAWHPVLQDYVAAHPRLKFEVEHAEAMQRLAARRARPEQGRSPEPQPSPGRSFGPGM